MIYNANCVMEKHDVDDTVNKIIITKKSNKNREIGAPLEYGCVLIAFLCDVFRVYYKYVSAYISSYFS